MSMKMGYKKLTAYEAATEFYNLFFEHGRKISLLEYLDNSFCDEMGEIDLKNDTFKIFYHIDNKYANPVVDGKYSSLVQFAADTILHPDDREQYLRSADPKNLLNFIKNSKFPNFAFNHYRFKIKDGSYRWVEEAYLTGVKNGVEDGIIKFYMFDIHNTKIRESGLGSNDEDHLYDSRDKTTGLNTEKAFYEKAQEIISNDKRDWCIISCDIEHFKLFDEWYGRQTGDFLLAKIGSNLIELCKQHGGVAGYFGQDDFAILYPFDVVLIEKVYNRMREAIVSFGYSFGFMPAFGVCQLSLAKDVIDALDKASLAEYNSKQDIKEKIHYYNPALHAQVENEYKVLIDFMQALKNDEITFYLQPQCRISTKDIVGAEALARWVKKDGTIIPPNVFIPVLEKYSFIADLDKYIWEKVCIWLRSWIDKKNTPVPISINVSQVDIFTIDVAEHLLQLVNKYNLEPRLLKVEITESAYAETSSTVKDLVDRLREKGFTILMDDFGSGYSSLNMLRSLKVDAVKLDALFLKFSDNDEELEKGIHILESIVNMTKTISLPIIVEGIETQRQTDFLVDLGCRYAQGFHFYRPMPIDKFEKLIKNKKNLDLRGLICKTNDQIKIREFLDENVYNDTMLNNILGPVAFYSWKDERVDIVRFNQQFYEAVGAADFNQRLENIERFMPEEDRPLLHRTLQESIEHKVTGAACLVRFHRIDGLLMTFFIRFYYLGEKEETHRFYGSATDLTNFTNLRERMQLIAKYTSDTIIFLKKMNGKFSFVVAAHGLEEATGISVDELDKELNQRTIVEKRFSKSNHIDLKALFNKAYEKSIPFSFPISLKKDDGSTVKIHMKADPVSDQANNVEYIFTFRLLNE